MGFNYDYIMKGKYSMKQISLNGFWEILLDPAGIGEPWGEYQSLELSHKTFINDRKTLNYRPITVPGTWTNLPEMKWYREKLWYIKRFPWCPDRTRTFLRFDSVNYHARVWLNGNFLGEHEGGYTPFEFEVTAHIKEGENYLAVKVDPIPGPDSTVPITGWTCHPGIIRSVTLYTTPSARLTNVHLATSLDDRLENGLITLEAAFDGKTSSAAELNWTIRDPAGRQAASGGLPVKGKSLRAEIALNGVQLWSPDTPLLYSVEIALNCAERQYTRSLKIGFRRFEVRPDAFYLNNKKIFLRGAGLHAMYPGLGHTIPEELYRRDYSLMKQAGMNAVRLVHYPHDSAALEIADEMGLLVWEEIPLYWQAKKEQERTRNSALQQLQELILRDRHHACVFAWGLGNEVPTRDAGSVEYFRRARELAKQLDPSRPVSFIDASSLPEANNPSLKYADFVAHNLYYGWYAPQVEDLKPALDTLSKRYPRTPLLITEFGAGAVRGHHGGEQVPWTEEFQARVLKFNIECFKNHPNVGGCFIWCWADFEDPTRLENIFERGVNNKGIVDAARYPKAAYDVVARIFNDRPEA